MVEARSDSLLCRWWRSRLGYRFIAEAALMVGLFVLYKLVRYAVRGQASEAFAHAREIIHLERALRFFTEPSLQHLVLHHPGIVRALNRYYVGMHFPVTIVALIWLYVRLPEAYLRTRRVLVITTGLGLVIHVLYPLAPPRMLPGFGFVDTGMEFGPSAYGTGSAFQGIANQFAAMPSLHFGWSIIIAIAIIRNGRTSLRWLIVAHPVLTTAAIVLTANHYWMDVIAAAALLGFVYAGIALAPDARLHRRAGRGHLDDDPDAHGPAIVLDDYAVIDLREQHDVSSHASSA